MMRGMVIDMNDNGLHTLARLRAFLDGTVAVSFSVATNECYDFIARTVRRFGYARLKRADKGVVLRFLGRVSGYSRQQLARLIGRARAQGPLVRRYRGSRTSFARTYTLAVPTGRKRPALEPRRSASRDTRHGARRGGKISNMKVTTCTVVDGKVVVEGKALAEGSTVTVVLREDDGAFELTPEEEAELLESIAAIERGEFVSGEPLLERLRRFG